jgi:hypothetical protein
VVPLSCESFMVVDCVEAYRFHEASHFVVYEVRDM